MEQLRQRIALPKFDGSRTPGQNHRHDQNDRINQHPIFIQEPQKLRQKRQIVRDWLMNSFGVDADKWVRIYKRRMNELKTIDWDNLED